MRYFFACLLADFLAWLEADIYYLIEESRKGKRKKIRFISVRQTKIYAKQLGGKTNKNRIKISELEKVYIYKTKDWSK